MCFFLLAILFLSCTLVTRLLIPNPHQSRRLTLQVTSLFCRWALKLFGLRVDFKKSTRLQQASSPRLIVANHVSDLDVLILFALHPAVFVTSVELRETSFLGTLAKAARCCFVERRLVAQVHSEIDELSEVLNDGFDVILFPEGTSSNGSQIFPFKSTFFEAAKKAKAAVQPICLNYRNVDGKKVSPANRDRIFYYGAMGFGPHLWSLCRLESVDVECRWLDEISTAPTMSRRELAATASQAIEKAFDPIAYRSSEASAASELRSVFEKVM